MVLRTIDLEKGKRFIIGLMAAILAFSGVGIINTPNSEATVVYADDAAMQTVADNLAGKTGISCWVASARVLEADDRLYFADDYTEYTLPVQSSQTVSGNQITLRNGTTLTLQVGDIIAFYDGSETSPRMPAHTITYIGAHGSHTGSEVWLSGGYGSSASVRYQGPTWGSTPTDVKLLRFSKTNAVNIPWKITSEGATDRLVLTPAQGETTVSVTNHPNKNNVKYSLAGTDTYANHVPKTTYTNASFSRDNNASYAEIIVRGTAAYFGDSYQYGTDMPYRYPIVARQKIAHGDQSDATFRDNVINSVKYIFDNFPDTYVKAGVGGDARYVNQNIRITDVEIVYHTVAGDSSSSDYNKTVKTVVYPISSTGTAGTPVETTKDYAIGEAVTEPEVASGHYFDGWYKSTNATHTEGSDPKSNIITKDMTGDDLTFYGFDRIDDGALLTINLTVKSQPSGETAIPLKGVTVGVFKSGASDPVSTAITPADGAVTFSGLTRGSYEVRELDVPTTDAGGNPVNYGYLKQTTIDFTSANPDYASGGTHTKNIEYIHEPEAMITIHYQPDQGDIIGVYETLDADQHIVATRVLIENKYGGKGMVIPYPSPTRAGKVSSTSSTGYEVDKDKSFIGWFYMDGQTEVQLTPTSTIPESFTGNVLNVYAKYGDTEKTTINIRFVDENPTEQQDLSEHNYQMEVYTGGAIVIINEEDGHEDYGLRPYDVFLRKDHSGGIEHLVGLKEDGYVFSGYTGGNAGSGRVTDTFPTSVSYTDVGDHLIPPSDITIYFKHGERIEDRGQGLNQYPERTITFTSDDSSVPLPEAIAQVATIYTSAGSTVYDAVTGTELRSSEGSQRLISGWDSVTIPAIPDFVPTIEKDGEWVPVSSIPAVSELSQIVDGTEVVVKYFPKAKANSVIVVTINGETKTFTYDGEPHTISDWEVTNIEAPIGFEYDPSNISYTGEPPEVVTGTDAGLYSQRIQAGSFVNNDPDVDVVFVVYQGHMYIEPKQVTAIANDKVKQQGESDPVFDGRVEGLIGSDTIDVQYTRVKGEYAGIYKILPYGEALQGNYLVSFKSGKLKITPLPKPEPEPTVDPTFDPDPHKDQDYDGWHDDPQDRDQTITIPGIRTTASDATDESMDEDREDYYYIKDKVSYYNLTPGQTYTLVGTLMNQETEEAIEEAIVEPKTFRPTNANGYTNLTFKVKREIIDGVVTVVFEKLYLGTAEEISEENLIAVHEDINDKDQTVLIKNPSLRTTLSATDAPEEKEIVSSANVHLDDIVFYVALNPGEKYHLEGTLHRRNSETGADMGEYEDLTGKVVSSSVDFFADETGDGSATVRFEFNSLNIPDGEDWTLVAFETLYKYDVIINPETGEKEYSDHYEYELSHADIDDEDQTILIKGTQAPTPEIGTTAVNAADGTKLFGRDELGPDGKAVVTINDTVSYRNLMPQMGYVLRGELYSLKGEEGNYETDELVMTTEKAFTPTASDGTIDIPFDFILGNYVDIEDETTTKNFVVFETLYLEGIEIADHADPNDKGQTVTYVPDKEHGLLSLKTTAVNAADNSKVLEIGQKAKLKDTVLYTITSPDGTIPDVTYLLRGIVHIKNADGTDGGILKVDGKEVTATANFKPKALVGTVDMLFEFTIGDDLKDKSLVVFEYAYEATAPEIEIANHADINDEGQTVAVQPSTPKIGTKATGKAGGKTEPATSTATVNDEVSYVGLNPGTEYTMKGELHLKGADGKDAGSIATAEKKFTPEKSYGTVTLTFTFDASKLAGRTTVAFERLYENEDLIASHAEISDKDQSVEIGSPEIKTMARGANLGAKDNKIIPATVTAKVVDTVSYSNLIPGEEYTMKGVLHLKGTDGKDAGGIANAEKKFKPTSSSGTVELTFTFDASKLQGRTVVVFEDCLHNGLSVATHADINDKDQSVTVENTSTPTPTPTPSVPTGDAANPIIFIVVGIVALAGVLLLVVYRNSSKKSSEEGENKEEDKKQKEETPKKE